ncbi:MAG: thiamine pyrophosphate-dependent dehydrogenase E1 component subunit alpha [Aigarchaeota archaeon]|nr:thiamine pyrophosphate-dependent dehydrogenase E1 component subunit alpha [Candidatus Pelearchaeum maunauluense]
MAIIEVVGGLPPSKYAELGLGRDKLLRMLRKMVEIRLFEERVERLFFEGKITGPSHLYLGEEAIAVGVAEALAESDVVVSTYRGHGHAIARNVPMVAVLAEIMGKATGTCKGLGGSMHAAISVEHGIPVATAIVGSGIPIAVGMGLAVKQLGEKRVIVAFFGDGAVNTGAFHEGLNLAAIWRIPTLFVCENNQYAEFTPITKTFAGESIAARAACYGIPSYRVDGNDVIAVYSTTMKIVEKLRRGDGPAFMECITYRKKGHGVYDTAWYRPREEVEEWMRRDPIERFGNNLKELGIVDDGLLKSIEAEVEAELDKVVEEAMNAPILPFEQLKQFIYST